MDGIYFNCVLSISATEGRIREGLVFDRNALCTSPCRASVSILESREKVHVQAFPDQCFLGAREGGLNKRGWVFQERVLAPRIVHFTNKTQVFWECHSLEASETLPWGAPGQPSSTHPGKSIGISSASTTQQVKLRWHRLVEEYSGTSLTFADDRLLVTSAVAKRFCSAMKLDPSEYLAGMWKDELPLSLLWGQN